MKTVPAIVGLADFSVVAGDFEPLPEVIVPPDEPIELAETPKQFISQQELDQAVDHARAEVEARYEQQIQQLREDGERQLDEARLQAIDQQADQLTAAVVELFGMLGKDVADKLFEKCRPVLGGLAREQAMSELSDLLDRIVRDNCKVVVSGPSELLKALGERLEGHDLDVDWTEEPVADILPAFSDDLARVDVVRGGDGG